MPKPEPMSLYPVVYTGPKEQKTQTVPNRPDPIIFAKHQDYEGLVAFVSEAEARYLRRATGNLYSFPMGDGTSVEARCEALESEVALLRKALEAAGIAIPETVEQATEAPKPRGRRPKAKQAA